MKYNDIEAINKLEEIQNKKFSDEQRAILMHHGGTKIVACAGSGKTTTLVNVVTKRIMTGEIDDPSKLLMTTYSKSGADEMSNRINELLRIVGSSDRVEVKTMHASYYKCLARFKMINKVVSNAQRKMFIRKAARDAKLRLEDSVLDEIDGMLSYQINNMMSDKMLYESTAYTVDLKLEDFVNIRVGYANQKSEAGMMDFDDMQYYMYYMLCVVKNPEFIRYCHSQWKYIYVDEFQDTSKIQFEILKALATNSDNLMVIGDDDQCFPAGSLVKTPYGMIKIEDLKIGDEIIVGGKEVANVANVDSVIKKNLSGNNRKLLVFNGQLKTTPEHVLLVKSDVNTESMISLVLFGSEQFKIVGNQKYYASTLTNKLLDECIESFDIDELYNQFEEAVNNYRNRDMVNKRYSLDRLYGKAEIIINNEKYEFKCAKDVQIGDKLAHFGSSGFESIIVDSIETEHYNGILYDINVSGYRNFIVNNYVVHNCIYAWRGADPSIILNIGAYYNLKKFYLSTNYRCEENILDFAATGVKEMYRREPKDMKHFKDGGHVEVIGNIGCDDLYKINEKVKDYIIKCINEDGENPSDIAVLVRNNVHAAILTNMLMQEGYYAKYGAEMKFSNMQLFKDLQALVDMTGDNMCNQSYNKETSHYLWKVVPYFGVGGASVITEIMENGNLGLTDAIGYMLNKFFGVSIDHIPKVNFNKTAEFKLASRVRMLNRDSITSLNGVYNALKEHDRRKKLESLIAYYKASMDFTVKDRDTRRVFICFFRYIANVLQEGGIDRLEKLIYLTKQYENDNVTIGGDKITISTVHSSKGMEWKHVILMAYDNICFPSFKYISELSNRNGVTENDIAEYIDGERRLNYVALTRAIDRLTLVGDFKNFSIFGAEALGINKYSKPNELIELAIDQVKSGRLPDFDIEDSLGKVVAVNI